MIQTYNIEIGVWLRNNLNKEINDLKEKQQKSRAGKASADRAVQMEQKQKRLARLNAIKYFTYNPNGENIGKNSLNHAEITSDNQWSGENKEVKTLTLEHHMAARRGGFNAFFEPLYQIVEFKTGLLDGTLSGIPFFAPQVLPLVKGLQT